MAQTSRISNTGTYFTVNGMFDEFTGAPVVDSSLQLWLDAGQTSSYSGTGNTWSDLSVSGNALTLTNGPTFASTGGGGSIVFDGVDDYASGSVSPVFTGNAPHSIDLWFYLTSYSAGRSWILQLGPYTTGSEHWILYSATSTQFGVFAGAQISPNIPLNTWINIITTFDGTTYTCYKNGVSVGSTAATFNFTGNILYLGLKLGGEFNMTGSIASCKLYSRALTGAEVVQNYNALSGRFGLPPVTTTQMPVIKRETSNAVILTNGYFDEFTGAPVVDTSLQFWLDAGQSSSYSGTGTTWTDLSVGGNVGTISGATFNSISGGGAFAFDGSNDIVTIPNKVSLDTQTPSVEVWVKTNNTNQSGFWFEKGFVNTQYSLFQEGTSILWRMYIGGITQLSTLTATYMNTAGWYQVVGTYTSGSRKLYINGVLVNSDTQTGTIATDNRGMSIGAYGGTSGTTGYFYNGSLAICRVYNKVLSQEEVVQNYNANCGRFGLPSITTTQMPVVKRETSTGIILVNGIFDEYTGILSPGLFKTTFAGYFADVVSFFATATPTTYGTNPSTSVQSTAISEAGSDDGSNFSCQWLGYFLPSTTETYTFFTASDDASYVWVGTNAISGFTTGNATVNNGGAHGVQERSGSIALTAGVYYPIRIQFGEAGGGDAMTFSYSTPTITKTTDVTGRVFYDSTTSGF